MATRRDRKHGNARARRKRGWVRLREDKLLETRLCDLDLTIEGTWLEEPIQRILGELESRDLTFRPHFWLSEEWFSPADIPGVAIPFYLAHPRLMRLERKMMFEVEGGSLEQCMKILRHEIGHAIQHAFQLQRLRRWQRIFGRSSEPYPDYYQPRPRSKRFVQHLDLWYAQSHPDEDFAETFAVWFQPRHVWRRRYRAWPALRKLEYVDRLMADLRGQKPVVTSRVRVDSLPRLRKTLGTFYQEKQERYGRAYPDIYDRDLRRLFSDAPKHRHNEAASAFLRRVRTEVRTIVCRWTGEYQFTLDQVLRDMIGRCRELKLRVDGPERQVKMDFAILLTTQTMNYLYSGRFEHPL